MSIVTCAGHDGTDHHILLTDETGALSVNVLSSPATTGAATEATLAALAASAVDIEINTDSLAVVGAGTAASAQRITVASDAVLPLPTGAATEDSLANLAASAVDIEANTDSLAVVGSGVQAAALRVTVASDAALPLPTGAAEEATLAALAASAVDIELNTDSLAVVGTGLEATALRVTFASDISSVLPTAPPVVGTFGNAGNGVMTSSANEKTAVVDIQYVSSIGIYANVDSFTTLTVEVSPDSVNWYPTWYTLTGSGSLFQDQMGISARYIRLDIADTGVTYTCTVCGK